MKVKLRYVVATVTVFSTISSFSQPSLAQTMPERPEGYFAYSGSVYAKAGGIICGFRRPGHLEIYRKVNPAPDLRITAISTYRYAGACPTPRSFFWFGGSGYYSVGNGQYCGFSTPQAREEYLQRFNAPDVGVISTNPRQFMTYINRCRPLQ
jgi:hypothetical protein